MITIPNKHRQMMKKILMLCAAMVTLATMTSCKNGKSVAQVVKNNVLVQGVVCDAKNHHTHPRAQVIVLGFSNIRDTVSIITTDLEGKYDFTVPKGTYSICVKSVGYRTSTMWLNAGDFICMDTIYIESLPPGVIEIDTIYIAPPRDSFFDDYMGLDGAMQKMKVDGVNVSVQ